MKRMQLRLLGHIVRMEKSREMKIVYYGTPGGTRSVGRPKLK